MEKSKMIKKKKQRIKRNKKIEREQKIKKKQRTTKKKSRSPLFITAVFFCLFFLLEILILIFFVLEMPSYSYITAASTKTVEVSLFVSEEVPIAAPPAAPPVVEEIEEVRGGIPDNITKIIKVPEEIEGIERTFSETYYPYSIKKDHFLRISAVYISGEEIAFSPSEYSFEEFVHLGISLPFSDAEALPSDCLYGILNIGKTKEISLEKITLIFNLENSWVTAHGGASSLFIYGFDGNEWTRFTPAVISSDDMYTYYEVYDQEIKWLFISCDPSIKVSEKIPVVEVPKSIREEIMEKIPTLALLFIFFNILVILACLYFIISSYRKRKEKEYKKRKEE